MSEHEDRHRIALARALTAAAGVPLRDRYGFAASVETVAAVVAIVFREPDDAKAADLIGLGNAVGDLELAEGYDMPIDEERERAVVRALRPMAEQRRDAAARSLR